VTLPAIFLKLVVLLDVSQLVCKANRHNNRKSSETELCLDFVQKSSMTGKVYYV